MKNIVRKILGYTLLFWLIAAQAFTEADKAHASWEAEWERTVEAAKKEGKVTIYTSSSQNTLLMDSGAFQKKFPEIKVIVAYGDPFHRILTERRAGKYLADVGFTGPSSLWELHLARVLDPIKDAIILPEVADESKWFHGKHHYVDSERKYIFVAVGNPDSGNFYYNTNLINPKEFQSMWDFLRPEWKGKITARDIRTPGPGVVTIRFYYYVPELGTNFIRRLFSEMDVTLFRDQRQGVDWLATGKYPICIFCNNSRIETAKLQGLPVEKFGFMREGAGLSSSGGGISLLNRAPHPHAAKVFINWYLSREGQIALQSVEGGFSNSRRMDIPRDMIPPGRRLVEGVSYVEVDTWERMSLEPMLKVFNAALAEAEKRRRSR
jgi:iron(III) transport system substrate-binding protein